MSDLTPEQLACDTQFTDPKYQGDFTMTPEPAGLLVLPWEVVLRIDALEARIADLEKRPMVKSRAEYMRKYRAKASAPTPSSVLPASVPPVTDAPPA